MTGKRECPCLTPEIVGERERGGGERGGRGEEEEKEKGLAKLKRKLLIVGPF